MNIRKTVVFIKEKFDNHINHDYDFDHMCVDTGSSDGFLDSLGEDDLDNDKIEFLIVKKNRLEDIDSNFNLDHICDMFESSNDRFLSIVSNLINSVNNFTGSYRNKLMSYINNMFETLLDDLNTYLKILNINNKTKVKSIDSIFDINDLVSYMTQDYFEVVNKSYELLNEYIDTSYKRMYETFKTLILRIEDDSNTFNKNYLPTELSKVIILDDSIRNYVSFDVEKIKDLQKSDKNNMISEIRKISQKIIKEKIGNKFSKFDKIYLKFIDSRIKVLFYDI